MKVFITIIAMGILFNVMAGSPVSWTMKINSLGADSAVIILKAKIKDGWHIYDTVVNAIGPVPTSFTFDSSSDYRLNGLLLEKTELSSHYDSSFSTEIRAFEKIAVFQQPVQLLNSSAKVRAHVEFMACNDRMCKAPATVNLTGKIKKK